IADQVRIRRDPHPLRAGDDIVTDLKILTGRRTGSRRGRAGRTRYASSPEKYLRRWNESKPLPSFSPPDPKSPSVMDL
ncbi:hypothetical protein PV371_37445, partial [Streptomyces sp. TX20-6-3]|uniref:hypothetical protein n=1 Tax=Streptomyces sp. TX20-6-3 TaxID=3028705 RepID=UPI0029BF43EA